VNQNQWIPTAKCEQLLSTIQLNDARIGGYLKPIHIGNKTHNINQLLVLVTN